MGEDFIRKTERTYRRSLQRTVERRFFTPPLLASPETTSTSYPCRLADGTGPVNTDAPFLLHRRPDRTIEILDTHNVIGTVDGEARHDLNEYLDTRPQRSVLVQFDLWLVIFQQLRVIYCWPRSPHRVHMEQDINRIWLHIGKPHSLKTVSIERNDDGTLLQHCIDDREKHSCRFLRSLRGVRPHKYRYTFSYRSARFIHCWRRWEVVYLPSNVHKSTSH